MDPALTIKDAAREALLFRARCAVAFVLALAMAAMLMARLVKLEVLDYEHFKTLSLNNRVKVVPVAPIRGLLFDRNGLILAQNTPTFTLEVVPEAVKDIEATIAELKKLIDFRDVDEPRFHQLLKRAPRFEAVALRTRLNEDEVARFAVNRHRFPGVDVRAHLSREYPMGPLGVHLVGYVGRINEAELKTVDAADYRGSTYIGKTGVEQAYEDVLHGTVGYQHEEINAQGRTIQVLERKAPVPGKNLYLTIDASLQAVSEGALGEENGAVVAIEPQTGEVLAFASVPGFDPNLFVEGIASRTYKSLLHSPHRPLFNRALHGRYPPGSTVKPFMGLAGLESGIPHAGKDVWCRGFYRLKGKRHRYRDWKRGGHGHVDLKKSIVQSCDVFYYELAHTLGIDRMHAFMSEFGFGRKTGIDLEGEVDGLMPSREWKKRARNQVWFPGETLITGIGQGFFLTTPIQLASATATMGTRGLRLKPRVVQRLEDQQTGAMTLLPTAPADAMPAHDALNWDTVIGAMVDVVHGKRGTARRIGMDATYRMAGKTGTAQVFGIGQDERYNAEEIDKKLQDHALFVSFAPVEQPRIAVAVVVENGGSGSKAAAPIARKVMDHYLLGPHRKQAKDKLMLTRSSESEAQE